MSDSNWIWVQLYFKGEDGHCRPDGQCFKIRRPLPRNIDQLKSRVYEKVENSLKHCSGHTLLIYPPGTDLMANPDSCIRPGKPLSELLDELKDQTPPTSAEHPLMVVAPAPPQQRQNIRPSEEVNGKKCSRFVSLSSFSDVIVLV